MKTLIASLALTLPLSFAAAAPANDPTQAFLQQTFSAGVPQAQALWLTGERRKAVTDILGHPPGSLRIRYWRQARRSAWVLEEIGKERPITIGVVIDGGRIADLRILAYREERGGEVQEPFFTRQFQGAELNGKRRLDRSIDGISGATLSVSAVKRVAREALYLASQLPAESGDDA
ncbi:MAG: FMN-binding protein [Gammaproteobacteria bacterium]